MRVVQFARLDTVCQDEEEEEEEEEFIRQTLKSLCPSIFTIQIHFIENV